MQKVLCQMRKIKMAYKRNNLFYRVVVATICRKKYYCVIFTILKFIINQELREHILVSLRVSSKHFLKIKQTILAQSLRI